MIGLPTRPAPAARAGSPTSRRIGRGLADRVSSRGTAVTSARGAARIAAVAAGAAVIIAATAASGCTAARQGPTNAANPANPTAAPAGSLAPATARRGVPAGSVHEDLFYAPSLGVMKHLVVYLPPSYGRDAARRYPVAYYLHGLSGTETDWISKGSIDATADSLFAHGTAEAIIVLPDGDDGWYTTWTSPVSYAACADTLHNEAPGRYCIAQARYDDYIARDVVAHVDSAYRTRRDRNARGIGGLSMGGYGALSIALRHPDIFGRAASHSGAVSPMYLGPHPFAQPIRYAETAAELEAAGKPFWSHYVLYWGTDVDRWRAADPARIAELSKRRGRPVPALFFDCGRDDGFIDQNRALDAELTRLGIAHQYAEWPGAHTWRYWSTHVPQSLAWMASSW